jgi:uncharacterized membrane protein
MLHENFCRSVPDIYQKIGGSDQGGVGPGGVGEKRVVGGTVGEGGEGEETCLRGGL